MATGLVATLEAEITSEVGLVQSDNLVNLCEQLESQYLLMKSLSTTAPEFFAIQLSAYMRKRDSLTDAKFLWKRLPAGVRGSSVVADVWKLGVHLWNREYSKFFTAVSVMQGDAKLSERVKLAVQTLAQCTQISQAHLISRSYSTITVDEAVKLCGFTNKDDAVRGMSKFPGCTYDDKEKLFKDWMRYVCSEASLTHKKQVNRDVADRAEPKGAELSLGQLDNLTRYVLELERSA